MIDFLRKFGGINSKINELFGYSILPDHPDNSTIIGKLLNEILQYSNSGNTLSRDTELNRLWYLTEQLEVLKQSDIKLFKYFIKELKKQDTQDAFWGIRFEISTAVSLINKDVKFKKQERPDFIIDSIEIECSSMHLRKKNDKVDYNYKISSLINKKVKLGYCSNSTVLFVDLTNMYYNLISKNVKIDTVIIKEFTKKELIKTNVGSILLFSIVHTSDGVGSYFNRIDNTVIDENLRLFLDKHYSIGNHYVEGFGITHEP